MDENHKSQTQGHYKLQSTVYTRIISNVPAHIAYHYDFLLLLLLYYYFFSIFALFLPHVINIQDTFAGGLQLLWCCFHLARLLLIVEPCHLAATQVRGNNEYFFLS